MGLIMASYGGLEGILTGLTKSTDHPSTTLGLLSDELQNRVLLWRNVALSALTAPGFRLLLGLRVCKAYLLWGLKYTNIIYFGLLDFFGLLDPQGCWGSTFDLGHVAQSGSREPLACTATSSVRPEPLEQRGSWEYGNRTAGPGCNRPRTSPGRASVQNLANFQDHRAALRLSPKYREIRATRLRTEVHWVVYLDDQLT